MNMNIKKIGFVVVAADAPAVFMVNAGAATGNASADIIAALQASETAALDFGSIVADATGADVTVTTGGTRTCGGTLICVAQDAGQAGAFAVTGEPNYTYSITLPTTAFAITHTDTTTTMDVTVSTDTTTGNALDGTGNGSFAVGGVLTVGANQKAGAYTGTYSVTVAYE